MARRAEISVIIPAYNEEKYIGKVIDGLRNQTFKDFEAIVVDGDSTDNTREIARKYAHVIIERRKGIGRARNRGAAAANGKILVFLDGDTKPSKNLLEAYHNAFKNFNIVAATGPILPLEKANKRVNAGYKFVSVYFVRSSIILGRPSVVGSNFAVDRRIFKKIGGFNEKFITYEDWDLSLRLRKAGRIRYIEDAVAYTSTRRVKAWGIFGYFVYHVANMFRYYLLKSPNESYEPIR